MARKGIITVTDDIGKSIEIPAKFKPTKVDPYPVEFPDKLTKVTDLTLAGIFIVNPPIGVLLTTARVLAINFGCTIAIGGDISIGAGGGFAFGYGVAFSPKGYMYVYGSAGVKIGYWAAVSWDGAKVTIIGYDIDKFQGLAWGITFGLKIGIGGTATAIFQLDDNKVRLSDFLGISIGIGIGLKFEITAGVEYTKALGFEDFVGKNPEEAKKGLEEHLGEVEIETENIFYRVQILALKETQRTTDDVRRILNSEAVIMLESDGYYKYYIDQKFPDKKTAKDFCTHINLTLENHDAFPVKFTE